MDDYPKVTLQDVQNSISKMIKEKKTSEAAAILWATNVEEDSVYDTEYGAAPGSILLGLEWFENEKIMHGTLKIEPPLISSKLN